MSDTVILTFLVLGILLVAAGVAYIAYQMTASIRQLETRQQPPQAAEKPAEEPSANPDALPFDPARPPKLMTYMPSPSKALPTPNCHCHGEPLKPGQKVLLWPVDDAGGFKIVCQIKEFEK